MVVFLVIGGFWYWNTKQGDKTIFPFFSPTQNQSDKEPTPTPTIPETTFSKKTLETLIADYLPANLITPTFKGKVFCDYHLYEYNNQAAYLWAHCEEYFLSNKQLKTGAGVSLPIELELTGQKEVLAISKHTLIENGESYEKGYPQEYLTNPPEGQAKAFYSQ